MTSDIETPTQPSTDTETADTETDDISTDRDTTDDKANVEAAKYRRRLRDTEAERDLLVAALADYRRRHILHAAEEAGLERGADLLDAGGQPDDFLGDDGTVDDGKVAAAVKQVLQERPHWAKRQPSFDLGARPSVPTDANTSWDVLLKRP